MISLGKARHKLERWLLGGDSAPSTAAHGEAPKEQSSSSQQESHDKRFRLFMEELEASSQEWLGKVRLINLDSIRQHVGPAWAKLEDRVELLAEKIIREEMTSRDKFLNMGGAEFLVFFAHATPEESRIRCLAIVEAIHEKLFGLEDTAADIPHRIAECFVIHRDDLALEWEARNFVDHAGYRTRSPAGADQQLFRREAELLEGSDVATSTQTVLDSIITRAAESHNIDELAPLFVRLKYLSRSLKTLEPVLLAAKRSDSDKRVGQGGDPANTDLLPLGAAWEDIVGLISVLDVGPDYSHADMLAALGRLQKARLGRAPNAVANDDMRAVRSGVENADGTRFEYVPVYRSVSKGECIHQGIYRVDCRPHGTKVGQASGAEVNGSPQQEALERATLEHAVRYLSDRKVGTRFMLMVPVHIETLRGPIFQRQISTILRAAQLGAKRRLLIEVLGYRDSDDTIGIRRAIEELRVHAQAVFLTLSPKSVQNLEKVAAGCKKSGIHALGMDVSQLNRRETDIVGALGRISLAGRQCSVATYVSGIASVPVLAKAIASGVNYVCAPALRPPLRSPDDAARATLDDLYSAV